MNSREQFEATVRKDWPRANLNLCDMPGSLRAGQYVAEYVQHAWWGWQASRASVVIELPQALDSDRGWTVDRDEVREAIECAGLKVVP